MAPKLAKSTSKAPGNDVLYILMLDKSGSMYGQRWTELKQAVREFLQTLASDPAQQNTSRVTIINYDHTSYMKFDQAIPEVNLVN